MTITNVYVHTMTQGDIENGYVKVCEQYKM